MSISPSLGHDFSPSMKPCGRNQIAGQKPVPAGTLKQAVVSVSVPTNKPVLPFDLLVIILAEV